METEIETPAMSALTAKDVILYVAGGFSATLFDLTAQFNLTYAQAKEAASASGLSISEHGDICCKGDFRHDSRMVIEEFEGNVDAPIFNV